MRLGYLVNSGSLSTATLGIVIVWRTLAGIALGINFFESRGSGSRLCILRNHTI